VACRRYLACILAAGIGGCTQVVTYTDELIDPRTGRGLFTRTPANFGAVTGFVVGVPISIVALPVTWPVYQMQSEPRDALSTFLFPSFVLLHVGTLVGAPFDLLEWTFWRSWQPEETLTPEEVERRETELDARQWSEYPVTPIYPKPASG
jgi:hypothetical protein